MTRRFPDDITTTAGRSADLKRRTPILLFLATWSRPSGGESDAGADPRRSGGAARGIPFSAALLLILGPRVLHYLTSRRHGVRRACRCSSRRDARRHFGAIIRIESPIPDRRALLEIASPGRSRVFSLRYRSPWPPEALAVAVHAAARGAPRRRRGIGLGARCCSRCSSGWCSVRCADASVLLHRCLRAWIGFLVTAINLLPSSARRRHVLHALVGAGRRDLARDRAAARAAGFLWWGWFLWGDLLLLGCAIRRCWRGFGARLRERVLARSARRCWC